MSNKYLKRNKNEKDDFHCISTHESSCDVWEQQVKCESWGVTRGGMSPDFRGNMSPRLGQP